MTEDVKKDERRSAQVIRLVGTNGYIELLSNAQDKIVMFRRVDAKMMRLLRLDDAVPVDVSVNRVQIFEVEPAGGSLNQPVPQARVTVERFGSERQSDSMFEKYDEKCEERIRRAFGHQVKLMPPSYVKAYVKRNKNDAADAAAICEAVTRPSMRFVPVKTVDQQAVLMLHRGRALLVRQRTMLVNALRAHMAEFGFIAAKGLAHMEELVEAIEDDETPIPDLALSILRVIVEQLNDTDKRVRDFDAKLAKWHREDKTSRLLATIPGVGVMGASAIAATVTDPGMFDSGRDFAAWLGMTPRQNSSGGKERLGGVSKRGDKYKPLCSP